MSLALLGVVGIVIACSMAILLQYGDPMLAGIPVYIACLVYGFVARPLRETMYAIMFFAAVSDAARIVLPSTALWEPPFYFYFQLGNENLNNLLPFEALRFSFLEVLYVLIGILMLVRWALRLGIDRTGRLPGTAALNAVLVFAFVGVLWLELRGVLLRGGDFRQSLWQFRQLFWLPLLTGIFLYAIRDARDFHRAMNALLLAAVTKIWFAADFFFTIARPGHFEPATITSHYDSMLYVICLLVLISRCIHDGFNLKNGSLLLVVGSWLMLGIAINNRRLAFVNLGLGLIVLIVILRGPVKKLINRLVVLSIPFIVAYIGFGQHRNGTLFKPARLVASVISQKDNSSQTRDIENYNLLVTLKQQKVMGSGWGHEYTERVRADDISKFFAQYRYIAHNSILWLWSIGGLLGFTLIWMPLCTGVFLARRAYLFARESQDRSAVAIALTIYAVFALQAWGDMGTQSINSTLYLAIALAISAKLAVGTGAFPARLRFIGFTKARSRAAWVEVEL
jgi:hypothetical protein